MIKEKDILIRVNSELKERLKLKATSLGLSVSGYVRMLITQNIEI